jgi:hypothetical protein
MDGGVADQTTLAVDQGAGELERDDEPPPARDGRQVPAVGIVRGR